MRYQLKFAKVSQGLQLGYWTDILLSRFEQLRQLESNFSITGPPPTFNAQICDMETIFAYQVDHLGGGGREDRCCVEYLLHYRRCKSLKLKMYSLLNTSSWRSVVSLFFPYQYLQGKVEEFTLSKCLKCDREVREVRTLHNGYRLMWNCQHCRRYLMKSTERVGIRAAKGWHAQQIKFRWEFSWLATIEQQFPSKMSANMRSVVFSGLARTRYSALV